MRPCPPWSQVARKLTSHFSSPPHPLPVPNSHHLRLILRCTKTTLRLRLLLVRNSSYSDDQLVRGMLLPGVQERCGSAFILRSSGSRPKISMRIRIGYPNPCMHLVNCGNQNTVEGIFQIFLKRTPFGKRLFYIDQLYVNSTSFFVLHKI
jgi:hypothetical protein